MQGLGAEFLLIADWGSHSPSKEGAESIVEERKDGVSGGVAFAEKLGPKAATISERGRGFQGRGGRVMG